MDSKQYYAPHQHLQPARIQHLSKAIHVHFNAIKFEDKPLPPAPEAKRKLAAFFLIKRRLIKSLTTQKCNKDTPLSQDDAIPSHDHIVISPTYSYTFTRGNRPEKQHARTKGSVHDQTAVNS